VGQLPGRVAVVTGGGRGIGRAIALRYAREGATVAISSRTQSDLDAVVAQIADDGGAAALTVVADASDRDDARRPVREAIEAFGRVDILVNNVGGSRGRGHDPFDGDDASFEDTLVLNLTSAFWTTREALPGMRERRFGRVISIGSGASKRAAGTVGYTTAKHGLIGMTKQLAVSAGEHGITVNLLCPGWTNTSLLDFEKVAKRAGTSVDEAMAVAHADNAQHRVLEPDELTGMATLLASDEGAGITGQVISVDGGYRL
jgi:NAD(P)-dependent dehydrogenase (short-subunit alcohol dehydrogenase family)